MTAPAPDAALRALEDKYEVLDKLAEGGMGAIYCVRHKLLGELRVVKLIKPQIDLSDTARERFVREAKAAARLRHPRIAQLFDFSVESDGSSFIIMEHIDGKDLGQLLEDHGPPSLELGVEILMQALQAIDLLHSQGLVHRDVAPDNLMLTRDLNGQPAVKLIDLGIVKATASGDSLGGNTAVGAFVGKARYTAPEQFKDGGAGNLQPVSDLYGLGVLGYELLTGTCPIAGKSFADVLSNQLFKPPVPFVDSDPTGRVPDPLRALLLRMLEKDPTHRPQTASEILLELDALRQSFGAVAHESEVERLLGDPEEDEEGQDATVLISRDQVAKMVAAEEAARQEAGQARSGASTRASEAETAPGVIERAPAASGPASGAASHRPATSAAEPPGVPRAAAPPQPKRSRPPVGETTISLRHPPKRSLWQRFLDLFR